jgi:amino acid transporter
MEQKPFMWLKNPKPSEYPQISPGSYFTVWFISLHQLIYICFLSPEGLAKTSNPASDLMLIWFGAKGSVIMSMIIFLSAAGAINGLIFTGGRVSYAIFKDYTSLSNLIHLHPKYRTPRKAIIEFHSLGHSFTHQPREN